MVDDHAVDVPPAPHMLVVRNDDRPGVIGQVGTILGAARINITDMDVARDREGGRALMVLSTEPAVSPEVQAQLEASHLVGIALDRHTKPISSPRLNRRAVSIQIQTV